MFRARDQLLDRAVAVKLLDDPDSAHSSMLEARATARVSHPGVVHIFDGGYQDGLGYVVLELVLGQSLADVLGKRGALPVAEAVELAAQVVDALDATHRQGLVHCDVKPRNIIVTPSGHAKLIDFGIARAAAATRTEPIEEIRGSVAYVSPEQALGQSVDGRADVYALGAVLYEMLVGRPPFVGATATATLAQRLVAEPEPPVSRGARITPEIEAIVMRALAREPRDRSAGGADVRDALRPISARHASAAEADTDVIVPQPVSTQPLPRASGLSQVKRNVPIGRRRMWPPRVVAVVIAAILCAVLVGALASSRTTSSDGVPKLVGRRLSEVPAILEQAGIPPAETTVLTRPVEAEYVGMVVDQQPQPRMPSAGGDLQIAVGVAK